MSAAAFPLESFSRHGTNGHRSESFGASRPDASLDRLKDRARATSKGAIDTLRFKVSFERIRSPLRGRRWALDPFQNQSIIDARIDDMQKSIDPSAGRIRIADRRAH
jgi:hypothetical protein